MAIFDALERALLWLLFTRARAFMDRGEPRSQEERRSYDGSTGDGNREFTEAENEGVESKVSGAVWRGIALFESRAPVPADCLALASEGGRRCERAGPEASNGTGQ